LKKKFKQTNDELERFKAELATKTQHLDEKNRFVSDLQKEVSNLKAALEDASTKARHDESLIAAQVKSLQLDVGTWKKKVSEESSKYIALEAEKDELDRSLSTVKQKLDDVNGQLTVANDEISKLKQVAQQHNAAVQQLESLRHEVDQAKKQRDDLKASLAETEQKEKISQGQVKSLKDEISAWKSKYDAEVTNNQKLQASTKSSEEVAGLAAEVARLNSALQELETKYEKEKEHKEVLEGKLAEAKKQLLTAGSSSQNAAQMEELMKKLEEAEAKLAERTEEVERLESEVEQWMAASEQLQKLGEDAVKEVNEEADRLREDVLHWQQQYEQQVGRRREAEAELANSEAKLNDLDNMLRRLMSLGQ